MNSPEKLSSAGTTPNKQVRGADRPSDHRGCPPEQPWLKVRTGVAKSPCKCGSHAGIYTTFDEINISDVSDGVYIGEYDVNFIYAKVEVTVQNGEITDIIILEHRHEHGKAAETVINEIVDEQRIDVDAVSGATNSSIVIKKAVENALKSGL